MMTDDAITVTSATQSEAEVRASLGQPPLDAHVPVAPVPVPAPDPAPVEAEADSPKPDAEISEAGRTLRRSRADSRKAKIQSEIDDLTRTREHERRELDRERRDRAQAATPPTPPTPSASPVPAALAAPQFTFATFDQYQAEHPDADYDTYQDARQDARDAWRQGVAKATQDHEEQKRLAGEADRADAEQTQQFVAHEQTFIASHPDYVEVLSRAQMPTVIDPKTNERVYAPIVKPFRALLMRAGDKAPQVLYYMGSHPEEATHLFASRNPAALIEAFTEIKLKALQAPSPAATTVVPPTPAPAPAPLKPVTDAPAPLEAVPSGATHTPSLQQLADDTEDADAYIARRRQELKRTG